MFHRNYTYLDVLRNKVQEWFQRNCAKSVLGEEVWEWFQRKCIYKVFLRKMTCLLRNSTQKDIIRSIWWSDDSRRVCWKRLQVGNIIFRLPRPVPFSKLKMLGILFLVWLNMSHTTESTDINYNYYLPHRERKTFTYPKEKPTRHPFL